MASIYCEISRIRTVNLSTRGLDSIDQLYNMKLHLLRIIPEFISRKKLRSIIFSTFNITNRLFVINYFIIKTLSHTLLY